MNSELAKLIIGEFIIIRILIVEILFNYPKYGFT